MKYIEYYYADKEKYKAEMSKHNAVKKSTMERHYYRLREYFKEHLFTLDELKSLVNIQSLKLITFYDMRRLKNNVDDESLMKHGFDYDDIQQLRERGLM